MKTKKTSLQISLIIFFLIVLTTPAISAWDDCPFGYEDEEYPGKCWRYIDTNNDGICDHSQSEPVINQEETETNNAEQNQQKNTENKFPILVFISFFVILILAIITSLLKKMGKITNVKEKIIWNLLLLIFFLPSAITGLILIFMPVFSSLRQISLNFIQLHNISSFFFMWISAYHIIWHTKYYVKGIKKLVKK